jgi:hypothetical protein
MRTHTVVWGHIYSSMRTHTVVCGHIYSSMRTHTVVWGHIYRSVCAHTDALLFPSAPPRMRSYYALVLCALFTAYALLFLSAPPLNFAAQRSYFGVCFFNCSPLACLHPYSLIAQRSGAHALFFLPALRCVCALIFPVAPPLNRALIEPSIPKTGLPLFF